MKNYPQAVCGPATQLQKQLAFERINLDALINSISGVMWSLDTEYKLLTSNNAFDVMVEQLCGKRIEQGQTVFVTGFTDEQLNTFKKCYDRAFAGETFTIEEYNETYDRWYDISFYPIRQGYTIVGTACYSHDITRRKNTTANLDKLNRLYGFISQVNKAMLYAKDEQSLFDEACRIAVMVGNFDQATMIRIDSQNRLATMAAQYNATPYGPEILTAMHYEENGPTEYALLNNKPHVITDITLEPDGTKRKEYCTARGFKSMISLPVKRSGNVEYILTIFSGRNTFLKKDEVALLEDVANNISFTLDFFEKEKQRTLSEERLKHNTYRFNQAQAITHLGNWELDLTTGIGTWSDETCRIYGLPLSENRQSYENWISFIHPDDLEHVMKENSKAAASHINSSVYHRIIRRDGTIRHIHSQAHFEFDSKDKPVGLYGTAHDITEQTANIEQLKVQNEQLKQIAWIQSHKVRGPLATILGLAELFHSGYSNNTAEIIEGILTTSKKLDAVIKEIVGKTTVSEVIELYPQQKQTPE